MYGANTQQEKVARERAAAALRGSESTLNEQLRLDSTGKVRDEVLDELAVAAQDIETVLIGGASATDAKVLRPLLEAIRLGEAIVIEVWNSVHA